MANETPSLSQRTFMTLGSVVLVVAVLNWGQKILVPLALAVLLTFILTPLVLRLQRRGVPRAAAVTLSVLLATGILGGVGWIIGAQLHELANKLPEHTQNITARIQALQANDDSVFAKMQRLVDELSRQVKRPNLAAPVGDEQKPVPVVISNEEPWFLSVFPVVAGSVVEVLASAGLVLMLVVFMLMRREDLRFRLIQLIGRGRLPITTRALDEAGARISAYLLMQLTVNTVFGGLVFVGLWLLGVEYAFLWGFLALLLRFIPFIGIWVALAFPLLLSITAPEWYLPLEVFGLFLGLEVLTANVFEPLLFSHSTGVSAIALLVAAAFWAWLWGPIGLLLSTPLTVCLIVLGRYVPPLRYFDILLGSEPVLEIDARFYQRLLAQDEDEAAALIEEYLQTGSRERVFDEVMVPALVRMKRDAEHGDLGSDEQTFICHMVRDILDDLDASDEETAAAEMKTVVVIGCPARDPADEVALLMLGQLLGSASCRVDVLSSRQLAAEMVSRVQEVKPALVCIAALPPGGLAHARYLCKRLRAELPELKILVGRWGQKEMSDRLEQRLRAAGADHIAATLLETRAYAQPFVQRMPTAAPARRELQTAR